MNCSDCRDIVLDIARGVAHAEAAAALDHANECAPCRSYLEQQRGVTTGLHALAATIGEVPSGAMEARLLRAVEATPAARPRAAWRPGRNRWLQIAAAVVITTGVLALWQRQTPSKTPQSTGGAVHSQSDVAKTPGKAADGGVEARSASATTGEPADIERPVAAANRQWPAPPVRRARPRIVQATGFVALPAAAMLPPFERGEIVRVQVRLATLADLGFTVQPDAVDSTPINVDLLVGQDGQPRAIRLVTDTQASRSRR
ncbi:MAG: hypothetical protein ACM3NQ_14060 [Bacteroidales bacterium]